MAHHRQAMGRAAEGYARALHEMYRDPVAAGQALDARAEAAGWDAAVREVRERAERFGALRGHQVGPFVVAGSERDRARAAVPALAGMHRDALLTTSSTDGQFSFGRAKR